MKTFNDEEGSKIELSDLSTAEEDDHFSVAESEENVSKRRFQASSLYEYMQTKHSLCSSRISGKTAAELHKMVRNKRGL